MTLTEDQSGNLISYCINASIPTAPTLNMWNSTQYPLPTANSCREQQLRAGTGPSKPGNRLQTGIYGQYRCLQAFQGSLPQNLAM
jgi:hypothetical protein